MDVNDKAPEFILPDQNGEPVSLKGLRGKTVVLYFYPRADTPGRKCKCRTGPRAATGGRVSGPVLARTR